MTDLSLSSPPVPKKPAWPTFVAWAVIVACVLVIVVAGLRPAEPVALKPDDAPAPDVDLLIQSRVAVGFARMPSGGGVALLPPLDEAAAQRSAVARLRVAIVAGELGGPEAALQRLERAPESLHADVDALRALYAHGGANLDAARRERLVARHGWFGRLAVSWGLPDHHPDRAAALAPAKRVAVLAFLFGFGALFACALGVVLLLLGIISFATGKLKFAHNPPAVGRDGPFVESFAVFLACMLLVSVALAAFFRARQDGDVPLAAQFMLLLAVPPAVLWLRLRGITWAEVGNGLGWHRGRGVMKEAFWGVAGYIAGLPLLAVALVVTSLLTRVSGTTPTHPIVQQAGGGGGGFDVALTLQLYLLAAVYAPLVEETMFRGALYHHCRRRMPWWLAAGVVGLIFAAIHPQGLVGIPLLATIGVIFATLRELRGSIVAPVVAHACVNGVTVTMLVVMTS